MDNILLESLLREDESSSLDFKREQYPFYGASDESKSELLKDILALANAWRRTTAYVLIGVEEVVGGRSNVLGITDHLKDSDLQQFVNSKTQRPLTFSYRAYPFEGKQLGIIEIPVQRRPFYLKAPFGKLKAEVVYIRRGSATGEANLDEVATMGTALFEAAIAAPSFELQFANLRSRTELGGRIQVRSTVLDPLNPERLMPRQHPLFPRLELPGIPGREYYRELIEYIADVNLLLPVGFVLDNAGSVAGQAIELKAHIPKGEGLRMVDESDAPIPPSPYSYLSALPRISPLSRLAQDPDPTLEEFPEHWELSVPFGRVLPRSRVWTTSPIYVGAARRTSFEVTAHIYGENLPQPLSIVLGVDIEVTREPMTEAHVMPYLRE